MARKCIHDGCDKRPTFGPKGGSKKDAVTCAQHKLVGFIDLVSKRCVREGCAFSPSYGPKGGRKLDALTCLTHKKEGFVDLIHKRCAHDGCGKLNPSFGPQGGSRSNGTFCATHKPLDFVDVITKRCAHDGCQLCPSYGPRGGKRAQAVTCATHKKEGYVNLVKKSCNFEGCDVIPCFGPKGNSMRHAVSCVKHKEESWVNLLKKKTCTHPGCQTRASFGPNNGIVDTCATHVKPGYVDLVSKRCARDGCDKQPVFGPKGGTKRDAIACSEHKEMDHIDLKNNRCSHNGCDIQSTFGLPGFPPSRCWEHRRPGMLKNPRKRCVESSCRELAIYGILVQEHCENHRLPDEVNIMERKCKSCGLLGIIDKNDNCETCDPETFKRVRLAKQNAVVDFLRVNGVEILSVDRMIDGGDCGKERPDILLDCVTHRVVIEVDEHQHSGRPCLCEQTRMVDISQSNGIKTLFLRFNPDKYKVANAGVKMDSTARRLQVLLEWTWHWIKIEPTDFLSVMYLYFDGYSYGNEKLETMLKMEHDVTL